MSLVKSYINRIVFHIFGIIFGPVVVHFSGFQIARNILIFYSCILIIFFGFIEIYKLYKKEKNSSRKFTFIYSVISLTVLLIGCLHSDNIIRYGAMLDDTMNAIFQTDLLEAIYYIVNNISFFGILLFMTWYSIMIFSYLYVSTFNIKSLESSFISYFLGLVAIFGLFGANIYSKEAFQIYYEAKEYKNILKNYSPSREKILEDNNINNFSTNFLGNIIVVLGESTSRHHMGIYNYFRNTTPNMIMRKNEIALFNNIISTHSHTVQSIIDALSLNKRKGRKSLNEVVDIITLMKAANFNVSWISNQNAASLFDSHVAAIAKQSDLTQYYSSQKPPVKPSCLFY